MKPTFNSISFPIAHASELKGIHTIIVLNIKKPYQSRLYVVNYTEEEHGDLVDCDACLTEYHTDERIDYSYLNTLWRDKDIRISTVSYNDNSKDFICED